WKLKLGNGIIEKLLGGSPDQVPDRYESSSPASLLPMGVKQVLIHGTADDLPHTMSVEYQKYALSLGEDATLILLQDAGHFESIDPMSKEWPRIVESV